MNFCEEAGLSFFLFLFALESQSSYLISFLCSFFFGMPYFSQSNMFSYSVLTFPFYLNLIAFVSMCACVCLEEFLEVIIRIFS